MKRANLPFALVTGVLLAAGCLRTSVLVEKFNSGVIETSSGDPKHAPDAMWREIALRRIKQELIDGYFGQSGPDARVVSWLRRDATQMNTDQHWFYARIVRWLCDRNKTAHVTCPSAEPAAVEGTGPEYAQQNLKAALAAQIPLQKEVPAPLCAGERLSPEVAEDLADTIRYRLAIGRAIEGAAALVDEGRISQTEVEAAAILAFQQSADYLARRQWRRQLDRPVVALVVKGGATTGIFSAGAVWVALNIDRQCARDPICRALRVSPRFEIMSGTSAGALVSAAVDIYNVSRCDAQREERLDLFQRWFVCSTSKDLFCTTPGTFGSLLAGHQQSLLEFDGIQRLLQANVGPETLANQSELLLNVVDFRTGRLDAFSDQDQLTCPQHVVSAVKASAALPLIVKPEPHLPGEPNIPGRFAYLDGGVRSELPIAAAARRGAERVFIVSSASSVVGESTSPKNGLEAAVRFIDVAIGGVLESEIEWAPRMAEGRRLAEFIECSAEYVDKAAALCPDGHCNPVALCSGKWAEVCTAGTQKPDELIHALRHASDVVSPLWRTTSIYRDESRVPGLPGYLLKRAEQRKLFLAGAEEARERCFELAVLLGLPLEVKEDPAWHRKLLKWCAPQPTPLKVLCGDEEEDQTPRSCDDPLPPLPRPAAVCTGGEP